MSIVGTQSVSLSDLMRLGIPALNAMAQGQQQSIAPSYMVISALKALTDQQKGMGQPQPQGTVKDQIVAATQPQTGIAGLPGPMQPPMQRMAGGGAVKGYSGEDEDSQVSAYRAALTHMLDLIRYGTGKASAAGDFLRENSPTGVTFGKAQALYRLLGSTSPTSATAPTAPASPYNPLNDEGPRTPPQTGGMNAPDTYRDMSPPAQGGSRVSGSVGISAAGRNPLSAYRTQSLPTDPLTPKQLSDIKDLNIPVNEYLKGQLDKYKTPDAQRMAELAYAEERAGLGAFARGIMSTKNGVGFGAAAAGAFADYSDAKMSRADQRRQYEDRREDIARQLALESGKEQRENFTTNLGYKRDERQFDTVNQQYNQTRASQSIIEDNKNAHQQAQLALETQKVQIQAAAHALGAQMRLDGRQDRHEEAIMRLRREAYDSATKAVADQFGKVDELGKLINPGTPLQKKNAHQEYYDDLLNSMAKGLRGMEVAVTPPAQTSGNRGSFPGIK